MGIKLGDVVLVQNVEEERAQFVHGTDRMAIEHYTHPVLVGTVIAAEKGRRLVRFNQFHRSSWFTLDQIMPSTQAAKVLYGAKGQK